MRRLGLALLGLCCVASEARADLVFLSSGRSLSVRAVREEGSSLVLTLRGGGEITCDRSVVVRITPDEVPYPEPEDAEAAPAAEIPIADEGPAPFGDLIQRSSTRHGVDANLVRAVIKVESGYQTRARSPKGAMGLMQLMPETARRYALRRPYDPAANIDAGTRYLKSLLNRFPLHLALAAYNAGEAAVERFQGIPPYPETRNYVARILQLVGRRADNQ